MVLNIKQNLNNKLKFETISVLGLDGRLDRVPKFFNGSDDHDEDENDDDSEYYGNVEGQNDLPGSGELKLKEMKTHNGYNNIFKLYKYIMKTKNQSSALGTPLCVTCSTLFTTGQ